MHTYMYPKRKKKLIRVYEPPYLSKVLPLTVRNLNGKRKYIVKIGSYRTITRIAYIQGISDQDGEKRGYEADTSVLTSINKQPLKPITHDRASMNKHDRAINTRMRVQVFLRFERLGGPDKVTLSSAAVAVRSPHKSERLKVKHRKKKHILLFPLLSLPHTLSL